MINIEHKYEDIVLISDNDYKKDRFIIYYHLFNEYDVNVLDYTIKIKEDNSIFEKFLDLECIGFENDILEVLEEFNPISEDEELNNCRIELRILCSMNKHNTN